MTCLASCATSTKTVFIEPPAEYLQDCTKTSVPLRVNRDLVERNIKRDGDLEKCSAEKRAARDWIAERKKAN